MGYRELEQCRDFDKLKTVFDDDMLEYFERLLEEYMDGSEGHPAVVCSWEGTMRTEDFIEMCG